MHKNIWNKLLSMCSIGLYVVCAAYKHKMNIIRCDTTDATSAEELLIL